MPYSFVQNNQVVQTENSYQQLMPNNSFAFGIDNATLISQYSIYPVVNDLAYDVNTQELVDSSPYLLNGTVYGVRAQSLDLNGQKAMKQLANSNKYNAAVAAGRNYNAKNYQIDDYSCQLMAATKLQITTNAVNAWLGAWLATDNTPTTMTNTEVVAFFDDVYSYVYQVKLNYWSLRAQIAVAADVQTLSSIDITAGWPSN